MAKNQAFSARSKKEIMIAILLACCLLLGVAVMVLVESKVGTPVFYDGEMKNICVRITEVCSSNKSIIATDNGEYPDYIELYNYGDTFNLADFGLSNETGNSKAYSFGDITFKENSYLIVFLDGIDVPFKLSSEGNEYLSLVSWDGTVIDKLTTVKSRSDEVMVWNGSEYELSSKASHGYPNTDEGVAAFLQGASDGTLSLAINEILTANGSVLPDFEGDFCDIIEIKNTSAAAISTKGYFISDTKTNRARCALPDKTLAPGEMLLVFASGKDLVTEDGEFHTDFKLSSNEEVILSYGNNFVSQAVARCDSNYSQSRMSGGEYVTMLATPGFENDEAGREALELTRINPDASLIISEVLLSQDLTAYGGKLRDVIEICNISDHDVNTSGWYISDSPDDPYKFALPNKKLAPNECLVIYAENGEGENICGFALSSGESVFLTAPDYRRGEYIPCSPAGRGNSRSCKIENGETVYTDGAISIGFANSPDGEKAYATSVRPKEVEISELVATNTSFIPGPYKTYHDLIELYNKTDSDIDLTGWYLSDDPEQPRKASLDGITIEAGSFLVIVLSSDGINTPSGYHVANFGINASGETVTLSKGDEIIDCMPIPSLGSNTSFGRPEGEDGFAILAGASFGSTNRTRSEGITATPGSSLPQGVYSDGVSVELSGEGKIYYTLDCTEPNASSTLYTSPIKVSSTTVIRCIAIADGKKASKVNDLTYIVGENDSLEAISLVTAPENLWDYYHGIYETGPRAKPNFPYEGANYYYRWERDASVSFFAQNDEGFSENCGIRIFGGLSRALPKKSFALFFRSAYGSGALNYKLFDDEDLSCYEALVLRNTGQDFKYSSMRDAMVTSMARDMLGLDVQNCRPVVLYLNGEYWGLYFIREKLNENYVAAHYNVSPDEAEVAVANGRTSEAYTALVDYAHTHDLSVAEHYNYVSSIMDIDNYIDYIVAEMIICNTDNGNIRFFTYEGGKWRWIMYDVDHAFRSANYNTVSEHLNPAGTGSSDMFSTRLINALLKNPEFKRMFLEEIAYQLENVWTSENIDAYVDEFKAMIVNDIGKDCTRWNRNYTTWESSVESLKSFGRNRESYVESYVKSYFSLSDEEMRSYGFDIE